MQFGRGRAFEQLLPRAGSHLPHLAIEQIDHVAHACHLLVGGAQPQFLLALQALPQVQYGFEWKTKGHSIQLGKARSLVTLSENETASSGFCIRNLCSSGISCSALSSVGSLPFW